MLERGINNMEQYKITDERLVREAAEQLQVALMREQVVMNDIIHLRIGGLVNNIRKCNRHNNQLKGLLRGLVQDMQARAKEGTTRNGTTDNTGTNGQNNTVRRTPPVKNGDMNGQKRITPVDGNLQHPRLVGIKEETKPKSKSRKSPKTKSPKVRSTPSPVGGLHPSPPKIGANPPPPDSVNKIPPFRIDPVGSEQPENGNLSKNGHHHQNSAPSSPAVDPVVVSSPKSKKRKLPMSESNDSTNKSPKSSTPSPETISAPPPAPPHQTNHVNSPNKPDQSNSDRVCFSDQARFSGSAVNDFKNDQLVKVPSTPTENEVDQAAEGGEVDGVTGVRDTSGTFHRWHEEITLDPDGTEPFMHILPYVDIDLELL